MTNEALLELAAKAAGYNAVWYEIYTGFRLLTPDGKDWLDRRTTNWNPLTDDGDALRLAVKLGLCISFETWTDGSEVVFVEDEMEYFDNDPYAATRRAIVRAAAEIGRTMK